MMLTVLHVYKDVHPDVPGGIERHIHDLRRAVPGVTSNVLICSRSRRTRIRIVEGGVEVAVGELGRMLSTPLAPTFPRWLKRLPADVIHLHLPNPTGEVAVLVSRISTPIVCSYHADVVRQAALMPAYGPVVNALLRRSRVVISGTHALARGSPLLRQHRGQIRVIPYGVDTRHFDPANADLDDVARLRERFGLFVIATGRLVHYKGFDRLIALTARIGVDVVIVGAGPLEAELRSLAANEPRAHLVGKVSDRELLNLLAAAAIFVLPSTNRAESFGIATLEAQAMGLPAVIADVGTGTVEAIEDGQTGYVVPARDDDALVGALRRLIDDDPLRRRMGASARDRAIRDFSLVALGRSMATLYDEVADAAGSDGG